ncbi:head GIN domain-containing protein [Chitinophaga sp. CB10]|uniref:head GIN domain-containing protein n=1 Tax=Chitinophaga sp. CB10 TaxID=1891659 RepID=UPI0025C32905|nr:head GIN domain-containing protein [Chitinophaga sp. CB10]
MKKVALYSLMIVPVLAAAMALSAFSIIPGKSFNERIKGSGNVKSENRAAAGFSKISTGGVYHVVLTIGNEEKVRVDAEDNLLPYIETEVSRGRLDIHTKKGYSIEPKKDITIYVTARAVTELEASGASGIVTTNQIKGDELKIGMSGATQSKLNVAVKSLDINLSGATQLTLSGTASSADFGVSGAANVKATDLRAEEVNVGASGGSSVSVNAAKALNASCSGGSQVRYKGEPVVNKSTSGGASVSRI